MIDTRTSWINLPKEISLQEHERGGRDKCVSLGFMARGSNIFSTSAFATVLLPAEKGRRCDHCLSLANSTRELKRCSGCASYWYCDHECQTSQWTSQHKKICKVYSLWHASNAYQTLSAHQKMDATLLSHLLSAFLLSPGGYSAENDSMASKCLSLLPFQEDPPVISATCPIKPVPPKDLVSKINARFGNNNFAIHSHLTTIGHGVFPAASRIFNHSCIPNAAAKYIFRQNQPPMMQVVALRDIEAGEEICIPYVDPALLETRQKIFRFSYGFHCMCPSCQSLGDIGSVPKAPTDPNEITPLSTRLCEYMGTTDLTSDTPPQSKTFRSIPNGLYPVLNEGFIQTISEMFSRASHEGDFNSAQSSGKTLLALYALVYPPNYPQIGMHLLEMAKSTWNYIVTSEGSSDIASQILEDETRHLLSAAACILNIYGPEGDQEFGPLQELKTLHALLDA